MFEFSSMSNSRSKPTVERRNGEKSKALRMIMSSNVSDWRGGHVRVGSMAAPSRTRLASAGQDLERLFADSRLLGALPNPIGEFTFRDLASGKRQHDEHRFRFVEFQAKAVQEFQAKAVQFQEQPGQHPSSSLVAVDERMIPCH